MKTIKILLLTSILLQTLASAAADKVDVTKVSAGFDLSYTYSPLGKGLVRQWSVQVSPDGRIQYRGAYQEHIPLARLQSCSELAGIFVDQLENAQHQELMDFALAAINEQKIIKPDEVNKENRERSTAMYTLRTERGEEFTTAEISNDEGPDTQKLLQTLAQVLERTYKRPRQALQIKTVRQEKSWKITFTSLASQVQTFILPSKAHEAFLLINELGTGQVQELQYAHKPNKFIHKLKPGEKVVTEILIPQGIAKNQRLVFDNMAIRHHGGGDVLHVQLCSGD